MAPSPQTSQFCFRSTSALGSWPPAAAAGRPAGNHVAVLRRRGRPRPDPGRVIRTAGEVEVALDDQPALDLLGGVAGSSWPATRKSSSRLIRSLATAGLQVPEHLGGRPRGRHERPCGSRRRPWPSPRKTVALAGSKPPPPSSAGTSMRCRPCSAMASRTASLSVWARSMSAASDRISGVMARTRCK